MPISRQEFNERRIDLTFPITDLLVARPDLAFTVQDVRNYLAENSGRDESVDDVESALEALIANETAEKTVIEGEQWYITIIVERRIGFHSE